MKFIFHLDSHECELGLEKNTNKYKMEKLHFFPIKN
jgi:hypothetical protein